MCRKHFVGLDVITGTLHRNKSNSCDIDGINPQMLILCFYLIKIYVLLILIVIFGVWLHNYYTTV